MAEQQPPLYLQGAEHPAERVRLGIDNLLTTGTGVQSLSSLQVTASATPQMQVEVSAGTAFILGTQSPSQETYLCMNDATVTLPVPASDPTLPRIDLVVGRVRDAFYSGLDNDWLLEVVAGTPAATPVRPNVPANAVVLAQLDVAATVTEITNADITDLRLTEPGQAVAAAIGGVVRCLSGNRPATVEGRVIYETDTDLLWASDGVTWRQIAYEPAATPLGVAEHRSPVTLNDSTWTALPMDTILADVAPGAGGWSGTSGVYVIPVSGTYHISAATQISSQVADAGLSCGVRVEVIGAGGDDILWADTAPVGNGQNPSFTLTWEGPLTLGDQIQAFARQDFNRQTTTASWNRDGNSRDALLTVRLVGP